MMCCVQASSSAVSAQLVQCYCYQEALVCAFLFMEDAHMKQVALMDDSLTKQHGACMLLLATAGSGAGGGGGAAGRVDGGGEGASSRGGRGGSRAGGGGGSGRSGDNGPSVQKSQQQQQQQQQQQRHARPAGPPGGVQPQAPGVEVKMGAKLVDRQLVFLPFFPSDNPGVASGDITQTAEVVKMVDASLEQLLAAPLHKFWSQLTHDDSLQVMMDSLLRYRQRAFDLADAVAAPTEMRHANEVAVSRLEEKVLQVLVRMSAPDGFGSQVATDGACACVRARARVSCVRGRERGKMLSVCVCVRVSERWRESVCV